MTTDGNYLICRRKNHLSLLTFLSKTLDLTQMSEVFYYKYMTKYKEFYSNQFKSDKIEADNTVHSISLSFLYLIKLYILYTFKTLIVLWKRCVQYISTNIFVMRKVGN